MQPRVRNLLQDVPKPGLFGGDTANQDDEFDEFIVIPPMRTQRDINALLDVPLSKTGTSTRRRVQTGALPSLRAATGVDGADAAPGPGPTSKKAVKKTALPLAEVLNANSPQLRKVAAARQSGENQSDGESGRKKRKLNADNAESSRRTLPRPAPTTKKGGKKRAMLPPLLPPLHDPPVQERRFPSMVSSHLMLDPKTNQAAKPGLLNEALQEASTPPKKKTKELPVDSETQNQGQDPQSELVEASTERPNRSGKRSKWTPEETSDLVKGAAKFGIGNWTKILKHSEYSFSNRTALDLKDRFRTCFPEEYRKAGSKNALPASDHSADINEIASKVKKQLKLRDIGVDENVSFQKSDRRQRTNFAEKEDESLLKGFRKYGARWKLIQTDEELNLKHRTRMDLRDRFRNRFPEEFRKAGGTVKVSAKEANRNDTQNSTPAKTTSTQEAEDVPTSTQEAVPTAPPSAPIEDMEVEDADSSQPLRLLTAGLFDVLDPRFLSPSPGPSEDEDYSQMVTLDRTILDWADQNTSFGKHQVVATNPAPPPAPSTTQPSETRTLSTLDQYHINPFVAHSHNSLPSLLNPMPEPQTQTSQAQDKNQQSIVPLSKILNETTLEDRSHREI
jgi:hypothetical protein